MIRLPRTSVRIFLINARKALQNAISESHRVTLVIGNESADLDSFTSSIVYAYIRSHTRVADASTSLYIPITNIPAADLRLRPEFLALLPHANLEPQHVITLDDFGPLETVQDRLKPENTRWILVDHNALQGVLGSVYSSKVTGCIDHHVDEAAVPQDTGSEPRLITKAGSCQSLVTEYCREVWDALSAASASSGAAHGQADDGVLDDAAVTKQWDAQVAKLALASVLIDTHNLTSEPKTTEHDVRAVEYLEAKIVAAPGTGASFDRKKFFEEIDTAKKDIGGLPLRDILRKDYKQWVEKGRKIGVSSVVKPLPFLHQKARGEAQGAESSSFDEELKRFAEERDLSVFAIMTTSTSSSGQFQRELLVWARTPETVNAAKQFGRDAREELGLEDWSDSDVLLDNIESENQWRKAWWQRNLQHSRKRVAPLLRQAVSSI